jgi:hypothetical protein
MTSSSSLPARSDKNAELKEQAKAAYFSYKSLNDIASALSISTGAAFSLAQRRQLADRARSY